MGCKLLERTADGNLYCKPKNMRCVAVPSSECRELYEAQKKNEGEPEDPEKPWRGICSWNCWRAKGPRSECSCKCGGAYHGKGRRKEVIPEHEATG